MRVLIVAQGLFPFAGGTAFSEASLCAAMSRKCETTILCRQGEIDFSFTKSYGLKDIKEYHPREAYEAFRNPKHWLRRLFSKIDVCHLNGHWRWEDHFFARTWKEMNVPYVMQPRGMLLVGHRGFFRKRVYNLLLGRRIVRDASKVIALSRFEIRQFEPYDVPSERILVLPNGITPVELPTAKEISPQYRALSEKPFFLYYGRLESRKNLLFLVDAFSQYAAGGGKCDLYFMGPSERNYDETLKNKIAKLGLQERVQVLPPSFQSERWHLVNQARAVVYPTREEPFGRVPFESLSAGTFPIIPDESGSAEYLSPLLPRSVYRHEDLGELVRALFRHENEPTLKEKRELEKARKWVHTELNWDRIVKKLIASYTELVPAVEKPRLRRKR